MGTAAVTVLGRVQPIYKGDWNNYTTYNILENVIYNGSTYVSIVDNNLNHFPTNTNYWQLVASKGGKGDRGDTGSFGAPTASAHSLETGATPTVEVSASGPDEGKIFDFEFGIPAGPYGFDYIDGTATALPAGEQVTVDAELDTSGGERVLRFDFGIPAADGQGAQSVDGVSADSNNNVNLSAVRYTIQNLSNLQKQIVCTNIDAIKNPSTLTFGSFLRYGGTVDNPTWIADTIAEISLETIDTIVI